MPIQGFTRLRQHNFGRQAGAGTKVAAKRAYGFQGVPAADLAWTDPDVATGALVPVVSPFRGAPNLTGPLTDPRLAYNTLPLLLSGIFGGGVTPSGAGDAQTWEYTPAVRAPLDDDDVFTYEFFDDTSADEAEQYGDGLLEQVEISGPEGLGALTTSMSWRFGSYSNVGSTDSPVTGTVPTPGVTPDINETVVYLKDLALYIASDPYDLDANQITDALHSFRLRIAQARDQKRYANGTQSFDVQGYGKGALDIELELTLAKTDDTIGLGSESDAWMSDQAVNRYIQIKGESTEEAESAVPYSWLFAMPARYYTRTHGNIAGNTIIVLTARAFEDADQFGGAFRSTVVNTLDNAGF